MDLTKFFNTMGLSKRERLYQVARIKIGRDLVKGIVDPEFGCVVALNNVAREALGHDIGGGASTYHLERALRFNIRYRRASFPERGTIILSPTGHKRGRSDIDNGHVGIFTDNLEIISNNSFTGRWDQNYNLTTWFERYFFRGKYPVYLYNIIF